MKSSLDVTIRQKPERGKPPPDWPLHKRWCYLHYGPGRINKYKTLTDIKSLVQYDTKLLGTKQTGRPLFAKNVENPYQYDIPFVNRVNMASDRIFEAYEQDMKEYAAMKRATSEPILSYRNYPYNINNISKIDNTKPGYKGYIQGYYAENIFAAKFSATTKQSHMVRDRPEILAKHPVIKGQPIPLPLPFGTKKSNQIIYA